MVGADLASVELEAAAGAEVGADGAWRLPLDDDGLPRLLDITVHCTLYTVHGEPHLGVHPVQLLHHGPLPLLQTRHGVLATLASHPASSLVVIL